MSLGSPGAMARGRWPADTPSPPPRGPTEAREGQGKVAREQLGTSQALETTGVGVAVPSQVKGARPESPTNSCFPAGLGGTPKSKGFRTPRPGRERRRCPRAPATAGEKIKGGGVSPSREGQPGTSRGEVSEEGERGVGERSPTSAPG